MNIVLWILQLLLAFHTLTGAVWKLSNTEQAVPSLNTIPHRVWIGLSTIESLITILLIAPLFKKAMGRYAPWAALAITAEMLLFCAIHIHAGAEDSGPLIYWLVVAAICAFIAYGRWKIRPL